MLVLVGFPDDWTGRACRAVYAAIRQIPDDRLDRLAGYLGRRGRRGLARQCVDCGILLGEQDIGDEVVEGLLCEPCASDRRVRE